MILFDYNSNMLRTHEIDIVLECPFQFQVEPVYYICIIIYSIDMLSVIVTEQLNIC